MRKLLLEKQEIIMTKLTYKEKISRNISEKETISMRGNLHEKGENYQERKHTEKAGKYQESKLRKKDEKIMRK